MSQTSFGTMLQWIERPFGTTVERDRPFLTDMANRIREKFYNLYMQYEMAVDVEECFELQEFCRCGQCDDSYLGVTLPSYMNTVEAAWFSREPISLYSKWRESKVGVRYSDDCKLALYDMPGFYPTELDMSPCGCIDTIQFLAKSPQDSGKTVTFVYLDESGDQRNEQIRLSHAAWSSSEHPVKTIKSVILPGQLRGGVIIRQVTGERILSEYSPAESVPSYRRVKVTGFCKKGAVIILRASRKFTPLYEDHDIVETANRDAIEDCARHIFYANSGSEGGMIQKSEYHRNLYVQALRGEQSRDIGINRENTTSSLGPPVKHSRLWGNRGFFTR